MRTFPCCGGQQLHAPHCPDADLPTGRYIYSPAIHAANPSKDGAACGAFSVMSWANDQIPAKQITCRRCLRMVR